MFFHISYYNTIICLFHINLFALKENLYNFYTSNRHLSRKEIFDRFIAIGAPERSLNRWLCSLEQNKTLKRKKVSGRIAKKATPKIIKAIKRKFNHGCSRRKTASAFNLTVSLVNYILKKYSDIRKYKEFKRPLMNRCKVWKLLLFLISNSNLNFVILLILKNIYFIYL